MRKIGVGLILATSLTIAQTFCLAVSMTGPMLPEQSMQKTRSTTGVPAAMGLVVAPDPTGPCAKVDEQRTITPARESSRLRMVVPPNRVTGGSDELVGGKFPGF